LRDEFCNVDFEPENTDLPFKYLSTRIKDIFLFAEFLIVDCLSCRHVGVLTGAALSRLAIMPDTPIATFVKLLGWQPMRTALSNLSR
jgi:hypothetical protein